MSTEATPMSDVILNKLRTLEMPENPMTTATLRALVSEIDRLRSRLEASEAGVAAMREAVEGLYNETCGDAPTKHRKSWAEALHYAERALTNPAGLTLLAELRELRKVVEKVPKTADGVLILPGMEVFDQDGDLWVVPESKYRKHYSTRALAEAARKGGER